MSDSDSRKKILVADDDPVVLDLLASYISSLGYTPVTVKDGLAAVKELEKLDCSIVVTDMMMPRMNGMELLRYIRRHHPRTSVIVVTGYDRTFSYTEVIKAGASDFISKPFSADELEAKLNRVIREQELVRQLELLSISDALTGLFNRRHFDAKIWEEVHRAHRQGHDAFLLLMDVDRFKEYNDQYGHPAGDQLLQTLAGILTSCIRTNVDWAFRFGGDEFSVIQAQIGWEQAMDTGRRIMEKYAEHEFSTTSLSVGVARFIRHEGNSWQEDVADLVQRADKAMYQAKQGGRNKIIADNESSPDLG
ncbi:MAG: diguanylate cyclase [Desulfobacterales bacterium]|nr:diguanylate cyclase [Desulfobacterales bacterium]